MNTKLTFRWNWLQPQGMIGRRAYLLWGIGLFALKFNLDRLLSIWLRDEGWTLFDYAVAWRYVSQPFGVPFPEALGLAMVGLAIPFLWTGMVLTVKRLRSAGLPLILAVLFFVPVIKLVFFFALCVIPARTPNTGQPNAATGLARWCPRSRFGAALAAMLITALLGVGVVWLGTTLLQSYGWSLFVGLPFCLGFINSLIVGSREDARLADAISACCLSCLTVSVVLILVALEGVICIIMAAPVALALALMGAVFGWFTARLVWKSGGAGELYCVGILAAPLMLGWEKLAAVPAELIAVQTEVVIHAPPETVWHNVVSFTELPPPREWIFRAGLAYPIRAEISGRGPGAVRLCQFSTGPFVEPITVWDEPRLLRFAVTSNPAPMQEWTPYHEIHPPHLKGFLGSEQGQFLLTQQPDGSTLLEGTTWYRHGLWPTRYWQLWSDRVIHTIHLRVLRHIKKLAEVNTPPPKAGSKEN